MRKLRKLLIVYWIFVALALVADVTLIVLASNTKNSVGVVLGVAILFIVLIGAATVLANWMIYKD